MSIIERVKDRLLAEGEANIVGLTRHRESGAAYTIRLTRFLGKTPSHVFSWRSTGDIEPFIGYMVSWFFNKAISHDRSYISFTLSGDRIEVKSTLR